MRDTSDARVAGVFIHTRRESDVDTSTVIETVREFLGQFISDTDIDSDLNYFEAGLLNSMFAMQLLLFVEEEFGIQVTNDDLDVKNFESLNAVAEFVTRKMAA
jgi:acyl carrier protein